MAKRKYSPVFQTARTREWFKNAVVGWRRDPADLYADGYFDAAELVATSALSGRRKDALIYPLCFLYRHSLEVALKEVIRKVERLIWLRSLLDDDLRGKDRMP